MKAIIEREVRNCIKNPLFFIGVLAIVVLLIYHLSPYFGIHYFSESEVLSKKSVEDISDIDIMDGYIPMTESEKFNQGLKDLYSTLVDNLGVSEAEANSAVSYIKEKDMDAEQATAYILDTYSIAGSNMFILSSNDVKLATVEEANEYIEEALSESTFTKYFAREYSDYLNVGLIIYAIIFFAFLFIYDIKRGICELLHTKPIKSYEYVLGKINGGLIPMLIALAVITAFFDVWLMIWCNKQGFPCNALDIWISVLIFNVPNLIFIISFYAFIALLFKNPLPALPILMLHFLYSNLGSYDENGIYGYTIRPLSLIVRFNGAFFETSYSTTAITNQIVLIIAAFCMVAGSMYIWERRRFF